MLNKFFSKKYTLFLLIFFTLVGSFLRFYKNTENPPELNIDEVSIGYNAYSILKTGRDEYGKFLPVAFESVGDFKPSGLIYLTVPSIYLFGLNEFGVRFPTVFFSTLSIIAIYFLTKEITKNVKISLIASLLLTILPWHIYYSRYASEAVVALFFLIAGTYFFLRIFEKGFSWVNLVFSALFLSYSMYTYHPQRIFIPLIIFFILLTKRNVLKVHFKKIVIFIIFSILFCLPLGYSILFASGAARAQMTFVANDIEFIRPVLVDSAQGKYLLLLFYVIRKYLNYFTSAFLFYNGLTMTPSGSLGLGVIYLFEVPLVIFGLIALFQKKIENNKLLIAWILLGILPASLTQNEQHPLRTLLLIPAVLILLSYGAYYFITWTSSLKSVKKFGILVLFVVATFWSLIHTFVVFNYYFPYYKSEAFMYGTKEAVLFALENKNNYDEIIFDPVRGVEGPYIVSVPHMYILFYSAFDPSTYQKTEKRMGQDLFGFDKFTIRKIDWSKDSGSQKKLFIGSPWSLPLKDINEENVLKKIYLKNGQLALLVVKSE